MKKIAAVLCLGLLVVPLAARAASEDSANPSMPVTEMVEKQMHSYSDRELLPSDLSLVVGYPLIFGIEYERMANSFFSLGVGAGSFVQGVSGNLQFRVYPMITSLSPYVGAGLSAYASDGSSNVFAVHGDAGLDYTFEKGWSLSAGGTYLKALSNAGTIFDNPYINKDTNALGVQVAMHFRF